MPVSIATFVLQVLLKGVVLDQETINRFYYGATAFVDTIDDFLAAFDGQVVANLIPFMNQNASFTLIEAQGVKGTTVFSQLGISRQGTNGGDCLPPYSSWDFTLVRAGARERNGYKRIAGVGEGNQTNGIANSGIVTALTAGATAMITAVNTTSDSWTPLVRRTRINKVPVSPAQYWGISNVVYSKIGTQNSRKYGHGR